MGTRGQPEEPRLPSWRRRRRRLPKHGIAGARTDAIAREARVNKALIYYYFKKDKETLYGGQCWMKRLGRSKGERVSRAGQ